MLNWLRTKNNREVATFVVLALSTLAVGLWTLFTYLVPSTGPSSGAAVSPPAQSGLKIQATYRVCVGDDQKKCGEHTVFIGCTDVAEWAKNECQKYVLKTAAGRPGGKCGYAVVEVTCTSN